VRAPPDSVRMCRNTTHDEEDFLAKIFDRVVLGY